MKKKTNDLCADISSISINHRGEQLCGDHVETVKQDDDSTVIVLADGLGSGVKANILATLTSKIISTMIVSGLDIEDCVKTIAATLPICSEKKIAYSTFTIIRIIGNERAEIIQYDNPSVIMIRDGENYELDRTVSDIDGKRISKSSVSLKNGDVFMAISDGVEHAGAGNKYNFGWKRSDIIDFLCPFVTAGFTAKALTKMVIDEVNGLYEGKPADDATVCTVRIRKREPMNILFGPPSHREDCSKMMSLFFAKEGKHIVCGGTTSTIAADFLGKKLKPDLSFPDPEIPPTATVEGIDLVTEGVITVNRVLEYAKDALGQNKLYEKWSCRQDGASKIARLLFEEATDINFFVGRAINPAHQNPDLPISFSIKMRLVEELSECLKNMGKRVKISYF
ncbi:MAG: SpoIIE family protein phosphatase [Acutalibacteraceae bacterium]